MSAHLLKHAVLATYLESSITDRELISALLFHFPLFIQRTLTTAPLQTVQDAVDVLKRLEMMEHRDPAPRTNPVPPSTSNPHAPFSLSAVAAQRTLIALCGRLVIHELLI